MRKKLGSIGIIGILVTIGAISLLPQEATSTVVFVADLEIGGLAPVSPGSSTFEATVGNNGPADVESGDTITVKWYVDGEWVATSYIDNGLAKDHTKDITKNLATTIGRHEVRVEVFVPSGYTDDDSSNNVDEGTYWILA